MHVALFLLLLMVAGCTDHLVGPGDPAVSNNPCVASERVGRGHGFVSSASC
jgi:hypothetical protein